MYSRPDNDQERIYESNRIKAIEIDISNAVMNPKNIYDKSKYITFWDEVAAGKVQGIFEKVT